ARSDHKPGAEEMRAPLRLRRPRGVVAALAAPIEELLEEVIEGRPLRNLRQGAAAPLDRGRGGEVDDGAGDLVGEGGEGFRRAPGGCGQRRQGDGEGRRG